MTGVYKDKKEYTKIRRTIDDKDKGGSQLI